MVDPHNVVTEAFTFTNTGTDTISNLQFDDYYNFHPDGSNGSADQFCGSTAFNSTTGTVKTVGKVGGGCSPVVSDGTMHGSFNPVAWDLGDVGQVNCTGSPPVCTTTGWRAGRDRYRYRERQL